MAESGGLENRCRGNPPTVGSNPTPSVTGVATSISLQPSRSWCAPGQRVEVGECWLACYGMTEPRPHTHEDRARIVSQLADLHRAELGANLVGLATQGSFARNEDRAFSALELVAFLKRLPVDAAPMDGEQILDGMFIDLVWTTEADYVASVKEITPVWYIAGSDRLEPVVNHALITRINSYQPRDLRARCLAQAVKRWPALHEATTKVLNALARDAAPDLGRLFFSVLDHVLVVLAFLNAKPYTSTSTLLEEALRLPRQPPAVAQIAAMVARGAYTDRPRVGRAVTAALVELEGMLEAEGVTLEVEALELPRVDRRMATPGYPGSGAR